MNIQEVIDYHIKAKDNLTSLATNEDMKLADRQHYIKRAMFHVEAIECLTNCKDLAEAIRWKEGEFQNGC